MLIPLRQYSVRPKMEIGESLAGYFYRSHGANGYRISNCLEKQLRVIYRGTPAKDVLTAFDIVQTLVGDSVELNRTWWFCKRRPPKSSNGYESTRPGLDITSVRFCILCLIEYEMHFALWEMPRIAACPIHKIELYGCCNQCSRPLSWFKLLPNWTCSCGQSIVNFPTKSANPSELAIAQFLAGAEDMELPINFKERIEQPVSGHYRLSEVYSGLEWGSKLRSALIWRNKQSNRSFYRHKGSRPYWSDNWVIQLFVISSDQLTHRILRVLVRRFRENTDMLCSIAKTDRLYRVVLFVYAGDYGFFQKKIQVAVAKILAEYQLKLPISSAVFYNPRISTERRYENQIQLMHWWAGLSTRLGELDLDMLSYQQAIAASPVKYGKRPHELELVAILNSLTNAAIKHLEAESFRALFYWWRIPSKLREIHNPYDVLQQIGLHLALIPDYELYFVGSLLRLAWQGKQ
ncbi:TniQ family protein [Candidatus Methylobacter oryzae]|uniref:TniQ domain-containing protein n=1 Tax=Candidatus Methylobacter oryzae TaxID=2497749 RepID=A0ABY3CCC6_9GAMM|nr:TniQ family protein [Candidatus Methylobacter oryzae]TRW98576.1 hypothetical protein EKO24_006990 [Candidatus Methylobacter oryzae]